MTRRFQVRNLWKISGVSLSSVRRPRLHLQRCLAFQWRNRQTVSFPCFWWPWGTIDTVYLPETKASFHNQGTGCFYEHDRNSRPFKEWLCFLACTPSGDKVHLSLRESALHGAASIMMRLLPVRLPLWILSSVLLVPLNSLFLLFKLWAFLHFELG